MIKRFTFADRIDAVAATEAPPAVRPVRLVVCAAMDEVGGPPARHEQVSIEWFTDADHLGDHDAWAGRAGSVAGGASVVVDEVVVDEVVVRGADWLAQRWASGGPTFTHLALARRAEGLTPEELSRRWRDHAGRAGASTIPDDVLGLAYVQNHPVPRPDGDWLYDAINEVHFDDLDGLARRVRWFEANGVGASADELFRASWFLAVRQIVLLDTT